MADLPKLEWFDNNGKAGDKENANSLPALDLLKKITGGDLNKVRDLYNAVADIFNGTTAPPSGFPGAFFADGQPTSSQSGAGNSKAEQKALDEAQDKAAAATYATIKSLETIDNPIVVKRITSQSTFDIPLAGYKPKQFLGIFKYYTGSSNTGTDVSPTQISLYGGSSNLGTYTLDKDNSKVLKSGATFGDFVAWTFIIQYEKEVS